VWFNGHLVHCVHDQHCGQGEANGHLKLCFFAEQGDLDNDQQGQGCQVGVGQMVQNDPLKS